MSLRLKSVSVVAITILGGGCDPVGPPVSVPRSDVCNVGVRPLACVTVPERVTGILVDGVQEPAQYYGAMEMPIVNVQDQDVEGKVFALRDVEQNRLHLFFKGLGFQFGTSEFGVAIDNDRFDAAPAQMGPNDRRYLIDRTTGAIRTQRAGALSGSSVSAWFNETEPQPGYEARLGRCVPEPETNLERCDVEMAIPLPPSALEEPAKGLLPGIGIAVSGSRRRIVMPEEISLAPNDGVLTDRTVATTLLFGRPPGIPFTFMSWNMAHWGIGLEWDLTGSPFRSVPLASLASVMASYDIVAVQEMWSRTDAATLLALVNGIRAASTPSLPPLFMYGPVTYPPGVLGTMGGGRLGDAQGGVFVFSRFTAIDSDYRVYDQCRGEDCLKPKGVQWVRLALDPPTAADLGTPCSSTNPAAGIGCPGTPTTEAYVDVFNTHLQANTSTLCFLSPQEQIAYISAVLAGCGTLPVPVLCAAAVSTLATIGAAGLTVLCEGRTGPEVIQNQIQEMAEFIREVVGDNDDQPAILAGDFNTDGRRLNACGTDARYGRLLDAFDLVRAGTDPTMPVPDDGLSLSPGDFPWDIDNADVAREMDADYDFTNCGVGTSLGSASNDNRRSSADDGMTLDPTGCPMHECDEVYPFGACPPTPPPPATPLTRDGRIDYLLVRPPVRPELATDPPAYMITQSQTLPVWAPLWPAVATAPTHMCAGPTGSINNSMSVDVPMSGFRISDHRPIVGSFEFTSLRVPARYHPNFDHRLEVRVTSMDATGTPDCVLSGCKPIEPYVRLDGWGVLPDGTRVPQPGEIDRDRCSGWNLSWPEDECMSNWTNVVNAPAGRFDEHRIGYRLFEYDGVLSDDPIATVSPGVDPEFVVRWANSTYDINVRLAPGSNPVGWAGPAPILSSDPFQVCSRLSGTPRMCVDIDVGE